MTDFVLVPLDDIAENLLKRVEFRLRQVCSLCLWEGIVEGVCVRKSLYLFQVFYQFDPDWSGLPRLLNQMLT